jgi:hypothetical protein
LPSFKADEGLHDRDDVLLAERRHRVLDIEVEAHVELDAADGERS